jgi:hypothetical protein
MRKFTIALAAAATALISTVGIAGAPEQQSFTRDGRTYVYTTATREDGRTVIEGRQVGSPSRFRLLVNGDRVTGTSNGFPVSFRAPQAAGATAVAN